MGSGIDTVIYEIASRLSKKDDVSVFCFKTDYVKKDCNFNLVKIDNYLTNTTDKTMILAPFFLDKITPIKKLLSEFDVVNTHHYPASYISKNLKNPLNVVTEWSAVKSNMFSSLKEKLYVKWTTYANKVASLNADLVLAPCDFVSEWIKMNYGITPKTIFLDGINFELFNKNKISSDLILKFPLLKGKKIILFVGRITESKNIHLLINIFSNVKKSYPNVVLLLVGNYDSYPNYFQKLKSQITSKRLEHSVIFTGVVSWEELPSFYSSCDIFATCSSWEGFLRAEAYAFDKPMICFDVGANSETVKNGKTGFLIKNFDTVEFEKRLCELLNDENLSSQLGRQGFKWASENLDFDIISKNFKDLCKSNI